MSIESKKTRVTVEKKSAVTPVSERVREVVSVDPRYETFKPQVQKLILNRVTDIVTATDVSAMKIALDSEAGRFKNRFTRLDSMVLGLVSDREDDVKRLPPLEADKAVKSFIALKQVRIDLSEGKENIHGKEGSTYDHRVNVAADPEYVAGNVAFDAVSRWLTSSDKPQA